MSNILIAGEDLRFTPAKDPDIFPLTGEVIARLAGAEDAKDYIVIQWLQDGQLETLRADEKAHSDGGSDQRFIVFRGSTIYLFEIDERRLTWGAPRIRGDVLKKLVGVDPTQYGVWQQNDQGEDPHIDNDKFADLRPDGREVFFTSKKESTEGGGR